MVQNEILNWSRHDSALERFRSKFKKFISILGDPANVDLLLGIKKNSLQSTQTPTKHTYYMLYLLDIIFRTCFFCSMTAIYLGDLTFIAGKNKCLLVHS